MRISKGIGCAIATVVLMGASGAWAQSGPAYGPAGCGLGNMIVGGGTGFSQVFAATTNTTSGTQTFGITSGTSNCDNHGTVARTRSFIENNREALAKDMSRGQGETIATLSRLSECSSSTAVGTTLQSEYRTVFPDVGVSDSVVSNQIIELLRGDAALSCQGLG